MSEHPKRENYDSDSDFLDAMADHYGIDRRMLRHIPIPKMIHDDDICPHLVVLGRLEAENARLKAEVERLTAFTTRTIIPNEELKAQVERVGAENAHLHKGIYSLSLNLAQLKDGVERLTKAGDAMAAHIERNDEHCYIVLPDGDIRISDWNAAKEGKQP